MAACQSSGGSCNTTDIGLILITVTPLMCRASIFHAVFLALKSSLRRNSSIDL